MSFYCCSGEFQASGRQVRNTFLTILFSDKLCHNYFILCNLHACVCLMHCIETLELILQSPQLRLSNVSRQFSKHDVLFADLSVFANIYMFLLNVARILLTLGANMCHFHRIPGPCFFFFELWHRLKNNLNFYTYSVKQSRICNQYCVLLVFNDHVLFLWPRLEICVFLYS